MVQGNETANFTLTGLSNTVSNSLKHHQLSLEITSNPAWYAIQALPYLMEYPYECYEQTFARYYANSLATSIANSSPRVAQVFEQWRTSGGLKSPLENNAALKEILLTETPWLRDALSETEQKKRIGLLFQMQKMKNEQRQSLSKLKLGQLDTGAWPWFAGGPENRFITQYIITELGHLRTLTGAGPLDHKNSKDASVRQMVVSALGFLDNAFLNHYEAEPRIHLNEDHDRLDPAQLQYLYLRSLFPEMEIPLAVKKAMAVYQNQIKNHWHKRGLYEQAMMSLIAHRNADMETALKIVTAIKENSVRSKELGMYWKNNGPSTASFRAPIETQALVITAFSEITADQAAIDQMKLWLLKHKQTNRWPTTKATTAASMPCCSMVRIGWESRKR